MHSYFLPVASITHPSHVAAAAVVVVVVVATATFNYVLLLGHCSVGGGIQLPAENCLYGADGAPCVASTRRYGMFCSKHKAIWYVL